MGYWGFAFNDNTFCVSIRLKIPTISKEIKHAYLPFSSSCWSAAPLSVIIQTRQAAAGLLLLAWLDGTGVSCRPQLLELTQRLGISGNYDDIIDIVRSGSLLTSLLLHFGSNRDQTDISNTYISPFLQALVIVISKKSFKNKTAYMYKFLVFIRNLTQMIAL